MRIIVYKEELIIYLNEDKLIFLNKFVFFYILVKKCRGPPITQITKIRVDKRFLYFINHLMMKYLQSF